MRPIASTNEERLREYQQPGFSFQNLPEGEMEVENTTGGMVTSLPLDKTPPSSWRFLRNARSREFWSGRRPGTGEIGLKPDALPILRLLTFVSEASDVSVLRVTASSAHRSFGGGEWSA